MASGRVQLGSCPSVICHITSDDNGHKALMPVITGRFGGHVSQIHILQNESVLEFRTILHFSYSFFISHDHGRIYSRCIEIPYHSSFHFSDVRRILISQMSGEFSFLLMSGESSVRRIEMSGESRCPENRVSGESSVRRIEMSGESRCPEKSRCPENSHFLGNSCQTDLRISKLID
jgi:hypothetical protein